MKRQPMDQEKIFANYIWERANMQNICEHNPLWREKTSIDILPQRKHKNGSSAIWESA